MLKFYSKIITGNLVFNFSKNRDIDMFSHILRNLFKQNEHSSSLVDGVFFFKKHKISKNDISDKIGIYRRIQYKGKYYIDQNVFFLEVNFNSQFILIFSSLLPPIILLIILYSNSSNVIFYIITYILAGAVWFFSSKTLGMKKIKKIIIQALHSKH
tara:strand:- start:251 stop:718 length:468 start_codon:yes stop_codon:yes gene_type:complete